MRTYYPCFPLPFVLLATALSALLALPAPARAADAPAGKSQPLAVTAVKHPGPVDFEKEILPALNTNCLACHNRTKAKANLVLETPADIRKGGDGGPAAVAGKADQSLLLRAAAHAADVDSPMPPPENKVAAADLTPEQLGLLKLWIDQGALGEVRGPATPVAWRPVPAAFQPIYAVALSPDGHYAACGRGNRIDLYDLPAGKLIAHLPDAHRDLVESLAFSPDGNLLASGSYREIKLWRHATPATQPAPAPPPAPTKPPAGKESAASKPSAPAKEPNPSPLATAPAVPIDRWTLERTLGGENAPADAALADRVVSLDFSPDGHLLASGGGVPSRSGEIRLWDVASGKLSRNLDDVHSDAVLCVRFSPDGTRLASGSADRFVRVTDLATGKVALSLEGHQHHVLSLAWRRDGHTLASGGADDTLRFWDAATGERGKTVQGFDKEVSAVCYVGDGDTVAAATGEGRVRMVRDSGADVRTLTGPADFFYAVAATRDGASVLAGGQEGVLRLWHANGNPPPIALPSP